MLVRIRRLRQNGRRIPAHEANQPEHPAVGDLHSTARTFELYRPLANTGPKYTVHDARVIVFQPGVGGMLIRGFEECRGAAVLKEWEATPLDQVIGKDGLKLWNWPR